MSTTTTTAKAEPLFERLEYGDRYFVHTAKNSIVGLVQIVGEVGSNADEAISRRAGRDDTEDRGEIHVFYDPEAMELIVIDQGHGMTATAMEARLKRVGTEAQHEAKRAFFHRGIREVFVAMGGGEITSIGQLDDGTQVVSRALFHPTKGIALVTRDEEPTDELRSELGTEATGTRVAIPLKRFALKKKREYEFGAMESAIRDCVQIRPALADPTREIFFHYGTEPPRQLRFEYPEGEDLVKLKAIEVNGHQATFWAKVADKPLKGGRSRQTRRHGLLIRGERAAYEASLGEKLRSHPAMPRVFGELRIDAIEELQRAADKEADDESQLVYKPDRSGLNPEHALVEAIYHVIDETLAPLVAELDAADEKRRVSPDMRRQLQKLAKIINEVVKSEDLGSVDDPGGTEKDETEKTGGDPPEPPTEHERVVDEGIDFAHDRIFIEAGKSRTVKVWFDGAVITEGAAVALDHEADEIVQGAALSSDAVPVPADDGIAELSLTIRAGNVEGRHEVTVKSSGYSVTLPVHVRYPRASGFISQIVPKDEDWEAGSALYDPATGVVTVFIGRPEFKDAETRARSKKEEPWKFPLYRQLVVESVREAALTKAAERRAEVEWDDLSADERMERNRFHELVVTSFQELDYLLRSKLLKVFLTE